jgi:hypothetical protein
MPLQKVHVAPLSGERLTCFKAYFAKLYRPTTSTRLFARCSTSQLIYEMQMGTKLESGIPFRNVTVLIPLVKRQSAHNYLVLKPAVPLDAHQISSQREGSACLSLQTAQRIDQCLYDARLQLNTVRCRGRAPFAE